MNHSDSDDALWVFAYGSLMWRPDFPFVKRRPAILFGLHRRLCVLSRTHRGSPRRPGLVFGLDRGGACRGDAYRIAPSKRREVRNILRQRELITGVYVERMVRIRLQPNETANALCFAVDRKHPQYAGKLSDDETLRLLRRGRGGYGRSIDYVRETAKCLRNAHAPDLRLEALLERYKRQFADDDNKPNQS